MRFEMLPDCNLINPEHAIDVFLECRENPSLSNIRTICDSCQININSDQLSKIYESFFLYKSNDAELDRIYNNIRNPRFTSDEMIEAVIALNTIYHTRLDDSYSTGRNIYELFNTISEKIKNNPSDAVDTVTQANHEKDNHRDYIYSFASKFCSFLDPLSYPIFDRYSSTLVYLYLKQKRDTNLSVEYGFKTRFGIPSYFLSAYNEFCSLYNLETYGYKKVDIFLWMYAKVLDITNGRTFYSTSYIPLGDRNNR